MSPTPAVLQPASPLSASQPIFLLTCQGVWIVNQLEKAALSLAAPLLTPGTACKITLLFACLHSVNVLSGYLLRNPAGGGGRHRFLFPIPIQKLRGKKTSPHRTTSRHDWQEGFLPVGRNAGKKNMSGGPRAPRY